MKKTFAAFALVFGLVFASAIQDASAQGLVNPTLDTVVDPGAGTGGGLISFDLVLDLRGNEGTFDTFELVVTPVSTATFNQTGNDLVMDPSEDSGFKATLTAPVSFGGQELSAFGVGPDTDTPSLLQGTFASLGSNAASTQGNYAIAQVAIAAGSVDDAGVYGNYVITFFDDGNQTGTQTGTLGVPEPASFALLASGLIGITWMRRRQG